MISFHQHIPILTARSPHPITMGPPAGIWLKESLTIMKNESWSISEPTQRQYVDLTGKPWKLGSSSEIILQNRSSDSLHSESLTWLHRSSHNPALSRTSPLAQHTTATQHQQPHPARKSQPKSLRICAVQCPPLDQVNHGYGWFCASSYRPPIEDSLVAKVLNSMWG